MSRSSPSEEELAAIVAAYQLLQRRAVLVPASDGADDAPAWRFSGRWWSRPIPSRRIRP